MNVPAPDPMCPACGHALTLHGPDGCLYIHRNWGDTTADVCQCPTPGQQGPLPLNVA